MAHVKLKRLKIQKYRNVKPGTELHFDDGINLVLGQNASGKTTLLALISAVCRADFSNFDDDDEEFHVEACFELGPATIEVTISRTLDVEFQATVSSLRHERLPPRWREYYRHTVLAEDKEILYQQEHSVLPEGWDQTNVLFHSKRFRILEDLGDAYRFDESLDAFAAATGRKHELSGRCSPPPSHFLFEPYPNSSTFIITTKYMPAPIRALAREDELDEDELVRTIGTMVSFDELTKVLGISELSLSANIRTRRQHRKNFLLRLQGFKFEVTRLDGTTLHHDDLSYGQKRLLAFYYYLACNPEIVIADELVNGLHHRWIDACMKALGDRQAFLTSQNPLLFDYVDFDSVEQVQARFVTCRLEQVDGREQMVWENMQRDDAERFFAAYQAELEHVGEILMNRGLW